MLTAEQLARLIELVEQSWSGSEFAGLLAQELAIQTIREYFK